MLNDTIHLPQQEEGLSPVTQATPEKPAVRGNWFHRNRWFTRDPVTNIAYQFFRSTMAAIPYGPAMAFGHHMFSLLSVKGQRMGLTAAGIDAFNKAGGGGLAAVEKAASENMAQIFKPGLKAQIGRNMMRVGNSPLSPAIQIAMGFTLFRFTGGVIKNLRDRVTNPKNTAEETNRETKNWWQTIKTTVKTNWKAESTGTPIAALVLGFMSAIFVPAMFPIRDKAKFPGFQGYRAQVKQMWSPKSKLLQNSAVWTMSYSLFFLLAECLFKDVQIRRGLWKGHPNSLKNGPDDTVGGPGAPDYRTPEKDPAVSLFASAEEGYRVEEKAKDINHKLRHPFISEEPSLGRFAFRRVLAVAAGISAYAALKRAGYLAVGGPMVQLNVAKMDALKVDGNQLQTIGNHLKFFGKNAWREGGATTMFGALWVATDAWGGVYDKFVHKLQGPKQPLSEHHAKNIAGLHERLDRKEAAQGRVA